MGILDKNTIEKWIVPHLTVGSRGFSPKVPLVEIVRVILYRLKTGCQWQELPLKEFFSEEKITRNTVFIILTNGQKQGVGNKFG